MSITRPYKTIAEFLKILQNPPVTYYNPQPSSEPMVSIICSFFNDYTYFEEGYQSIINQTFQNFELLIVDDCSTDPDSIKLFQSLPERSPKIKTFSHETEKGPSAGRNTAISHAKGKYLFFMDLDDIIEPTYVEKCLFFLETHPDFSFVNSKSIGFQAEEYWWDMGFYTPSRFIQQNLVTGRLMYRKTDFDALGGFDEDLRFYEDWERWLRGLANHQKAWTIPEYLDCYRRKESGLLARSRNNPTEEKRVTKLIQDRYKTFFEQNELPDVSWFPRNAFEKNEIFKDFEVENSLQREPDKTNILCLFPWLERGGADKFNRDLIYLLNQLHYTITIVTAQEAEHSWQKYFYQVTPDIFHLPHILPDNNWLAFIRYLIQSRQIDIVFLSNSYISYYFLPFLQAEFSDVLFVDYTHTCDPGWRKIGYPRISAQLTQFLDAQLVTSQNLADVIKTENPESEGKLNIYPAYIELNRWSPDVSKKEEMRDRLSIPPDKIILLYPARIVAQKRPFFLVDIVQGLVEKKLPIQVLILGSGALQYEMEVKINELNLKPYFKVLPPVEPEEMIDYYAAADLLLLPSAYEGISLALYEAMSMGLPVVASDVGGQRELVTPDSGFLVELGDSDRTEVDAYLQVLTPLIENAPLREKMGQAARQRILDNYPLEVMGETLEKIFQQAKHHSQTTPHPQFNRALAEEMLILAIEYQVLQREADHLWSQRHQALRIEGYLNTPIFRGLRKIKRLIELTPLKELKRFKKLIGF